MMNWRNSPYRRPSIGKPLNECTGSIGLAISPRSVRNAGYHDQREVQERTHDVVVKLLTGTLFKNFDERHHGPLDNRFKISVANAVKNLGRERAKSPSIHTDCFHRRRSFSRAALMTCLIGMRLAAKMTSN